ncbi:MAG: EAL domain-containing protein [Wenzhouxiangellaceae bacterium]|nr:EAL domain-containing protein [Wenzhouxiangellaceae bacterium]
MPRKPQNSAADAPVTRARGFGWAGALLATTVVAIVDWREPGFEPGEFTVLALGAQFALQVAVIALAGLAAYLVASRFTVPVAGQRVSEGGSVTRPAGSAERSLFDRHPDAVFEFDPECRLRHMNPVACRMLSRTPEEVVGRGLETIAASGRVGPDLKHLRAALGGQAQIFDSVGVDSTGRRVQVQVTAIPRLVDGAVGGLYCIVKNVDAERRMYEKLAASEGRLRAIVEHSMDAIFLSDPVAGRLLECNPATERLFGRSVAELRECRQEDVFDLERSDIASFTRQRDEQGHARGILYLKRPDGRRIPVEATSSMYRDGRGQWRTSVMLRDISEQQRREEKLRASEARFRAGFENSPDAIVILDPETGCNIDANPAAERLMKMPLEEIAGLTRSDDVEADPETLEAFLDRRITEGSARMTCRLVCGDGSRVPVDVTSATFRDGTGRLRAISMVRDIREQIENERRLAESEQRYRTLFEQSADAILLSRPDGTIDGVNPAAERMFRCSEKELIRLGREGLVDRDDPGYRSLAEQRRTGSRARAECRMRRADGTTFPADVSVVAFDDADGRTRTSVAIRDVTEMRELYRQVELLAAAFRSANEALLVCDSEWRVMDANLAYEKLTGVSRDRLLGNRATFLGFGRQSERILHEVESAGQWRGELLFRDGQGRPRAARVGISEIRDSRGSGRFLVINLEDVSKMREFERRIDFLSYNDGLTGLPNLRALQQWYDESGFGSPSRRNVAVVYLDLDRFKAINESFGHSIGDEVLIEVGRRLREQCQPQDFVTRLGGDDFVVVVTGVADEAGALRCAERLVGQLSRPIESGGHRIFTSASAGVVIDSEQGMELEDILRRADAAHAAAKRRGRGQVHVYDDSLQRDVEEHALVETHLREAIRQGELSLVYQPIVRLATGAFAGLEALVRWNNPALGDVPPGRFIPVAEESGLIVELGAWIFEQACRHMRDWLDTGIPVESLSINISPAQFQQPALVDEIADALDRYDLDGRRFTIEITENILMTDPERATEVLERLCDLGILIAIDDFGTGYSSLAYLRQFPLRAIKLDRTFVRTIPASLVDSAIVRSVIELSGTLGLRLIAEGIETEAQRDALRSWGCEFGQGFLFSEPLNPQNAARVLQAQSDSTPESRGAPGPRATK